tara:strand:- start:3652 stop:4227 length:576 start_codon:yes stop_codon:yes gene_type:complete
MESDLSLINKIKKSGDDGCLVELINRHSGIYVYIVDKYTKNRNYSINRDLILDDKDYTIYKSALDYNPDKNSKFSTFLANQTKWKCLNAINALKNKRFTSIDKVYSRVSEEDDSCEMLSKMEAFDVFNDMLEKESDPRVKKIIDIRYNTTNNKLIPWKKASEELNLSIQGCINIHNRFIKKVKNKFDNNYV